MFQIRRACVETFCNVTFVCWKQSGSSSCGGKATHQGTVRVCHPDVQVPRAASQSFSLAEFYRSEASSLHRIRCGSTCTSAHLMRIGRREDTASKSVVFLKTCTRFSYGADDLTRNILFFGFSHYWRFTRFSSPIVSARQGRCYANRIWTLDFSP